MAFILCEVRLIHLWLVIKLQIRILHVLEHLGRVLVLEVTLDDLLVLR